MATGRNGGRRSEDRALGGMIELERPAGMNLRAFHFAVVAAMVAVSKTQGQISRVVPDDQVALPELRQNEHQNNDGNLGWRT